MTCEPIGIIAELFLSDVGPVAPSRCFSWLAVQMAHTGLGAFLSLLPLRWGLMCLVILAVKEAVFDLPRDAFALSTVADSLADVAFVALGFLIFRRRIFSLNAGKT
jgi:hypothetical protein